MEHWITRGVALLVALGALGLFWTLGTFAAVPLGQGRLLALSAVEAQLIGVPLVGAIASGWGALHLFELADRAERPAAYRVIRTGFMLAAAAATAVGASWSLGAVVAVAG